MSFREVSLGGGVLELRREAATGAGGVRDSCHAPFPETNGDPYDFLIPPTSFGTWLKNLRLRRGLKQRDLARALGVRPYTLLRYEADLTKPAPSIRARLRKVLKLNGEFERFL